MISHFEKIHQLRLQLSSKELLELYTWLHDTNSINRCDSVDLLRSTILATMLANLDACKTPYVAVGDIIIPMTQDHLEEMAFGGERIMRTTKSNPDEHLKTAKATWDDEGDRPINPDVLSVAVMQDDENVNEENAAETAELDETDTRALLDELQKNS